MPDPYPIFQPAPGGGYVCAIRAVNASGERVSLALATAPTMAEAEERAWARLRTLRRRRHIPAILACACIAVLAVVALVALAAMGCD